VDSSSKQNGDKPQAEKQKGPGEGLILIAVGAIFLAGNFMPGYDFSKLWPLILIAIGLGSLLEALRK